jgi:hypothetical protein
MNRGLMVSIVCLDKKRKKNVFLLNIESPFLSLLTLSLVTLLGHHRMDGQEPCTRKYESFIGKINREMRNQKTVMSVGKHLKIPIRIKIFMA